LAAVVISCNSASPLQFEFALKPLYNGYAFNAAPAATQSREVPRISPQRWCNPGSTLTSQLCGRGTLTAKTIRPFCESRSGALQKLIEDVSVWNLQSPGHLVVGSCLQKLIEDVSVGTDTSDPPTCKSW